MPDLMVFKTRLFVLVGSGVDEFPLALHRELGYKDIATLGHGFSRRSLLNLAIIEMETIRLVDGSLVTFYVTGSGKVFTYQRDEDLNPKSGRIDRRSERDMTEGEFKDFVAQEVAKKSRVLEMIPTL